jgi:hypothetical protein
VRFGVQRFGVQLVGVAIGAVAVAVAAVVFTSVGGDVAELARGAGWWSLLALAWPALIFALRD